MPVQLPRKKRNEPSLKLVKNLGDRVQEITKGNYARSYRDPKGNILKSNAELMVARLLDFAGIEYEYGRPLPLKDGSAVSVDFSTEKGIVEVADAGESIEELRAKIVRIEGSFPGKKIIVVSRAGKTSDLEGLEVPVVNISCQEREVKRETIFMDDPSFAFDYAHILPWTKKCSVLHGHTSSVLVEIIGSLERGMIVDFGDAKDIIRDCLRQMDHKLFISRKYLVGEDGETYRIKFRSPNGYFDLKVPKQSTFLMDDEATIENLADVVLRMVLPKMPANVDALGVYIYEGLNKGSHLLASVHDKNVREAK